MPSLRKRIARSLLVSWRVQPNRYDIEALQANIRRVGLVIRVRWILIVVLVIYSLLGGALYLTDDRIPVTELARLMIVPAIALGFVVLYNTFYAMNYRRLANISIWNHLQLLLDAVVVTVLVYYSGGASSWFWSMYSLFILEATFILPRSRDTWMIAGASIFLLGGIELLEYVGVLPHMLIPFANPEIHTDPVYMMVRFLWQVAVLVGTAWVATALVGDFRRTADARSSQQLVDDHTGLYSRAFFLRTAISEMRRALRDRRQVHILLIDVDRFGEFNERLGFDTGDKLIKSLAEAIEASVVQTGDASVTANVTARFGGEEFVVLFSEDVRLEDPPTESDALQLAEHIRTSVASLTVEGAGVTVSIGVASAPRDGHTLDELLDAADAALVCAADAGGNRVLLAHECTPDADTGSADVTARPES